jgi:hypothetical protein
MNYFKLFILFIAISFFSCSSETPESKSIKETLGKELKLDMFKTVLNNGDTITLDTFLEKYKFLYIIYLLDDCSTCYEKYIEWHNKMSKIRMQADFSILFIISGKYADDFLYEVNNIEPIENKYFIVMDPNFYYPDGNTDIPNWILEQSVLIDNDHKVRLIGSPFANSEKLKRFKEFVEL